ncbi:MAG TPA: proton-conducting transporter membrane subunit [Tenuifilum sp.]|uniref:complex I subunit 5 family protein n=1 Tax=Tenuifilum sp. TaxID=2760880 RepID=UPI002C6B9202|nr:proton-conducting transporter membrane subunit [Tenuifilum sp.]HQG72269.1 proton-conducting transporter membrane subunit [Tenuifilum sp.]
MTILYLLGALSIGAGLFINRNKLVNYILTSLFIVLQWGFTIYAYFHLNITEAEYFTFDSLGVLLLLVLSTISIPAIFHSHRYIDLHNEPAKSQSIYFSALIILIAAIGLAYLANHIAVMWIFAEITTLAASALIYHHRNKLALEGTWKYVFICAVSVAFIFIGILFLSLSLGKASSDSLSFQYMISRATTLNQFWLKLAFLFIFTGFTVKAGLVPMFTAGVDAKDKAPGPIAALLSSVLMNMGVVGIFRTYKIIANTPIQYWANLVIGISAVLSIFVATVYMIKVKNIKRMFAYSSIEHMGLVMLAISVGGIGYYAAILHIVLHAFVKSSLFFQYNQIYRVYQDKNIYHIGNYFKYNPTGAIVILLGFISATAMPPSGLFVSEFLIFRALFEGHQIFLLIAVLLLLTIIIWAFAKNILKVLFTPLTNFDESNVPIIKPWESYSQYALIILSIYLGLTPPDFFVQLIKESVMFLS